MKRNRVLLSMLLVSLILLSSLPLAYAAEPSSIVVTGIPDPGTYVTVTVLPGTATVDGDPSEWNYDPNDPTFNANYVATLFTGWDPNKPPLADVYMRYDCDAEIMYAFFRTRGDLPVDQDMATTWIAENDVSNKLTFLAFAWVYNGSGVAVGWEASFAVPPEALLLVHTNVSGATAGTAEWLLTQASCPGPSAISLLSFDAQGTARSIVLNWETATEIDNLGFNLVRAESPDGPWTRVNANMIASQVLPGSPMGAVYQFEDKDVQPGVTYYYQLEAVDIHGQSEMHGPVSASMQLIRRALVRPRLRVAAIDKR